MSYDVVVVGGGPAGLSAALQVRAREKSALVVGDDRDSSLWKAEKIDNYLGLPDKTGAELLTLFAQHAERAGVARNKAKVLSAMPMGEGFFLSVGSDVEEAGAIVLALGVSRGKKVPGEERLLGAGVSYCATCDGALYRNRPVAVVGASADAPEEANFLAELGCQVTYVAPKRPDGLREDLPFVKGVRLEVKGEKSVEALSVDGADLPCDCVFFLRPSMAPADLIPGLALNGSYIAVDREQKTNLPGVFAAGDCTGLPLQISKAVGEGMMAGHKAAEYLDAKKRK